MMTANSGATAHSPLGELQATNSAANKAQYTMKAIIGNAGDLVNYYPLAAGAIISASPRIPIVKMVAKPVDQELKKRFKTGL
jgi:hypothetical protein